MVSPRPCHVHPEPCCLPFSRLRTFCAARTRGLCYVQAWLGMGERYVRSQFRDDTNLVYPPPLHRLTTRYIKILVKLPERWIRSARGEVGLSWLPAMFQSLTRHADEYVLGPLPRGSNYVTPQTSDALGRKCNCNTVMFRYETDSYPPLTPIDFQTVQLIYGLYCLSKCHYPVVEVLEPVLW